MAAEALRTRRKFKNEWDEIKYLRHKLLYWLYEREDRRRAIRFGERLGRLVRKAAPDHQAILGEECWSLISEARGDLAKAIAFRENEIRLMKKWLKSASNPVNQNALLTVCGTEDLADRLDLLAALYYDAGNLDRAIHVLHQSEQWCELHDIPFDGRDLLREYLTRRQRAMAQ